MLRPGFTGAARKGADHAREVIAEMRQKTRSEKARLQTARLVLARGNYTPEGLAVWAEWLAQGCPADARKGRE